jgi:chemosensory pili system protein ChpB (putative protein-glutamate methylesterase)
MRMPAGAMSLPVAIVCNSERRGNKLRDLLQANGVSAQLYTTVSNEILSRIGDHPAAVIVDLDGGTEKEQRIIDDLVSQGTVPVLFNDGTCLESHAPVLEAELGEQIAKKIYGIAKPAAPFDPIEGDRYGMNAAPRVTGSMALEAETYPGPYSGVEDDDRMPVQRVWVLGASLGGPEAVKRFVSRLPANVPAAFILVQRIGAEYTSLLRDQIDRMSALQVLTARSGHVLRHGQLLIAPMDRHVAIDRDGWIQLVTSYSETGESPPTIDDVMIAVAERFGSRAGAIIFSGIGNDGVTGARAIQKRGGPVWTQTAESCIMRSMPDHVRNACAVDMDAAPEELADELMRTVNRGRLNEGAEFAVANAGLFNTRI